MSDDAFVVTLPATASNKSIKLNAFIFQLLVVCEDGSTDILGLVSE